ncbi:MAG TPA: hypothetical protein VMW36_11320, partial [Patescibacteria group bacterium]|nr:hypothetical protein [Patescibacteria group bacterium]
MAKELKAHKLTKQIEELEDELFAHQEKCKHAHGTFYYNANTGNYDPSSDSYWIVAKCDVCLKNFHCDSQSNRKD